MFRHRLHLSVGSRLGRPARLTLAATCFVLAAVLAVGSPTAGASGTVLVVVARHDLAAGQVVGTADIGVSRWPRALAPPTALRTRSPALGRRLAAPVGAGEPLMPQRLVGRELAARLSPEAVAMSVPVTDARVGDFVHAGDRVDLYPVSADAVAPNEGGTGPVAAAPVAQALPVLAVLPPAGATAGSAATLADEPSAELILAVNRVDAGRIASRDSSEKFAVVLDPP